jgi:7-cyano-7-deazaguanine synthase in queuosine biosynthesis
VLNEDCFPAGYIIPNRNSVIAACAAFCDEIWIVANYRKIDDEPGAAMDKCRKWYWTMTQILSEQMHKPTRVTSPFLHWSKADSLAWFIRAVGYTQAQHTMDHSVTCYSPGEGHCGQCFACFKKLLALYQLTQNSDADVAKLAGYLVHSTESFRKAIDDRPSEFIPFISRELHKGRDVLLPPKW